MRVGAARGKFKEAAAGEKGGVRVVKSAVEARAAAEQMIGNILVTHQSGPAGNEVKRVYVESGCDIARELYLSIVVDRGASRITIMASTEGGVNIEDVAAKTTGKDRFSTHRSGDRYPRLSLSENCFRARPSGKPSQILHETSHGFVPGVPRHRRIHA